MKGPLMKSLRTRVKVWWKKTTRSILVTDYGWVLLFAFFLYGWMCFRHPFADRVQSVLEVVLMTCVMGLVLFFYWLDKSHDDIYLRIQLSQIITLGLIIGTSLSVFSRIDGSLLASETICGFLLIAWFFSATHTRKEERHADEYQWEMWAVRIVLMFITLVSVAIQTILSYTGQHAEYIGVADIMFITGLGLAVCLLFLRTYSLDNNFGLELFVEEFIEGVFELTLVVTVVCFMYQYMELWIALPGSAVIIFLRAAAPYRVWWWSAERKNDKVA